MSGIKTGIDLLEIPRLQRTVQRYGDRFLNRIYTPGELIEAGSNTAYLAALFAAKEAVSKALGTGIGDIAWQEIEIRGGDTHQPQLFLWGSAQKIAEGLGLSTWSLSISHSDVYTIAVVIAS